MAKYIDIEVIHSLSEAQPKKGTITKYWLHLISNGIAQPISIPVIIAQGVDNEDDAPVLGITAAVHGNELNGIPVIQRLFQEIDPTTLRGTLIGVPVVNVISIMQQQRRYVDGVDLNRIMPGKMNGNRSEMFAYRFTNRILKHFDYLLDLHTASFGRVNSYYIRADMKRKETAKLARLQNAEIILNNTGGDSTVRSAAADMGIHAITIELGDPSIFQKGMIQAGLVGVKNVMAHLKMTDNEIVKPEKAPIYCKKSYWIYANRGGILEVFPKIGQIIEKGDRIAIVRDVFGDTIQVYEAPESGVVIGKSTQPVGYTGGRILHLGIIKSN